MKTLNAGELIGKYRVLSVISQSNSEIVYSGYNTSDSTYVTIQEFYPRRLNIKRLKSEVLIDESNQAEFDRLATLFKKSADLFDDSNVLSRNNTFYIVVPQIIDTDKRDEIFARLEEIDEEYELANSKDKSKNRLSVLAAYEEVFKTHREFFYSHSKSVNNLASCYFYHYFNDALSVNSVSECVEPYTQNELNKKALYLYLQSAYRGSAYAQHQTAFFYEKGYGCLCNYQLAAYWYSQATNSGHKTSAKRLGDFYFYGQGVEQSYEEAVKCYKIAAEINSNACLMLVKCYEERLGVEEDEAKQYYYLNKAYELGNSDPSLYTKLAKCYLTACGTDENLQQANKLIKKAALLRYTSGVFDLIFDVYAEKNLGYRDKIRGFLYLALSHWDHISMVIVVIGILAGMFLLGSTFLS